MFRCGICGKPSAAKEKPTFVRIAKKRYIRRTKDEPSQPAEVPAHQKCALKIKLH